MPVYVSERRVAADSLSPVIEPIFIFPAGFCSTVNRKRQRHRGDGQERQSVFQRRKFLTDCV